MNIILPLAKKEHLIDLLLAYNIKNEDCRYIEYSIHMDMYICDYCFFPDKLCTKLHIDPLHVVLDLPDLYFCYVNLDTIVYCWKPKGTINEHKEIVGNPCGCVECHNVTKNDFDTCTYLLECNRIYKQ